MRPLLAFTLLVGFATAAPVPKSIKKPTDQTAILGTWKTTNPKEHTHTHTFETDGHLRQLFGTNGVSDWDWMVFPDEIPKRLTMVNQKGKSDAWHAVYELDGDSLIITYTNASSPLPRVADPSKSNTYTLTRVK